MLESALKAMRAHREKLLYLVVGGWNTLFQYVSFSVLYYLLHAQLFSSVILFLSYALSSINGFLGFRYVVFKSNGIAAWDVAAAAVALTRARSEGRGLEL